jgi:misacylated tRNA(Ala) deacylase
MTEALFHADAYLRACTARVVAVSPAGIVLDRTVFYAAGGGQPGDTGEIADADGNRISIVDVRKSPAGILHVPAAGAEPAPGAFTPGAPVTARIDWARRHAHMRMHTCLHLLCALIAAPVTGGSIAQDRGRLDFDLGEGLDKPALEAALRALIAADHPVGTRYLTDAEMDANMTLVRTMSVAPPRGEGRVRLVAVEGVDLQPCGGTHVARTGEIGAVTLGKIENKGKHNRRVNVLFA